MKSKLNYDGPFGKVETEMETTPDELNLMANFYKWIITEILARIDAIGAENISANMAMQLEQYRERKAQRENWEELEEMTKQENKQTTKS